MRHEKTLYQNSTLDDLRKTDSACALRDSISNAAKKDRAQSANRRRAEAESKGDTLGVSQANLDAVFEELENLNNNDSCLTTRIQKLEQMLRQASGTIKVHTDEINELKINSSVSMEPIKTDGPIDTNASFAKIKALEI